MKHPIEIEVVELTAFDSLKDALIYPPILSHPKAESEMSIDTDASIISIKVGLFQKEDDGIRHPIVYWSTVLNKSEKNCSMMEKECLALVWATKILRSYLIGNDFRVYTDHSSLKCLLDDKEPSERYLDGSWGCQSSKVWKPSISWVSGITLPICCPDWIPIYRQLQLEI